MHCCTAPAEIARIPEAGSLQIGNLSLTLTLTLILTLIPEAGSLQVGKRADFCVLNGSSGHMRLPFELQSVYVAGKHAAGQPLVGSGFHFGAVGSGQLGLDSTRACRTGLKTTL